MSHNYLNKTRTQELINTIRGHLSDIATVLSNLASGDARDNTKAPINHNQPSSTINAMTGYSKPQSTSAITASDTLNSAIGKLEKAVDEAGGGGDLEAHIATNVEDDGGVHGIRCYNGKLEVYNDYSHEWCDPSEVGYRIGDVSNLTIKQGDLSLSLNWSDPADTANATWKGTKVVMKVGSYPESVTDGQLVCDNQIRDAYSTTKLVINNLSNNVTYYFQLFPYTNKGVITTDNANRISAKAVMVYELGLRADFVNSTFTRLGDAVGLNGGSDFDDFPMYQRRRCNLADDGTVNAYLGDANYAADGSNGQVMVEQPKFYYKVVPVTLSSKVIKVAEYWISNVQLEGYKLHPAFKNTSGNEIDYFYEGAYQASTVSSKLTSISGATPNSSNYRDGYRAGAANRGTGWRQETIWSLSADQILMIIEYGMFNMQVAIGSGYTGARWYDSFLVNGSLDIYGNGTYGTTANETTGVQWRGKENPWGNVYEFIDGINAYGSTLYIANSYDFVDKTSTGYTALGFSVSGNSSQYFGRFGYDSTYDWLFIPCGYTTGDSSVPIGDYYYYSSDSAWKNVASGGYKTDHTIAGLFFWMFSVVPGSADNRFGARLLYVG